MSRFVNLPTSTHMQPAPVLFVDLDGTLVKTDMLLESFLYQIKERPIRGLASIGWLAQGKAKFKSKLAEDFSFNATSLPFCHEVIEYIKQRKAEGAKIVLATASNIEIANLIAQHIGLFDEVIASNDSSNLKSEEKLSAIRAVAGDLAFEYIGNSSDDIPVWKGAQHVTLANPTNSANRWATTHAPSAVCLTRNPSALKKLSVFLKAARLHQWIKNVLIFVPLLAAHKFLDITSVAQALLAFIAFGFCASAIYLVNDLLDLESDRAHPRKRNRPFAAGTLPLSVGLTATPTLLLISAAIALGLLPPLFSLCLAGYLALTLAYSFSLKRKMIIDVIVLASLYTSRILAGAAATQVSPSFWLLAFSMFIFLALALIKRYAELHVSLNSSKDKVSGRNYLVSDMHAVLSLGSASGMMSVLVLALYINSSEVRLLYSNPVALWALCPLLLYWISRLWLITQRGGMHDDPIVYAVKDKVSRMVFGSGAVILFLGTINITF